MDREAEVRIDRNQRRGAVEILELWASNPEWSLSDLILTALFTDVEDRKGSASSAGYGLGGWSLWSEQVAAVAAAYFESLSEAALRVAAGWTPWVGWMIASQMANTSRKAYEP